MTLTVPPRASLSSVADSTFAKIDQDIAWVMGTFQQVLTEQGLKTIADHLPWTGKPAKANATVELGERGIQMLSIAFQLLNMVEENAANQSRRARESHDGLLAEAGMWGRHLAELRQSGVSGEDLVQILPHIRVEPVLTAHPTESKRSSVLEQHRMLYLLLVKRENRMWTPAEQEDIREELAVGLERLWRTGEIRLSKPDIASERRGAIHYLKEIFPDVLGRLDNRLRHAWEAAGYNPELIRDPATLPRLRFGTWVGGDRDGHPLVTAQVTNESLRELRKAGIQVVRGALRKLAVSLSLSDRIQRPPASLTTASQRLIHLLGDAGTKAVARNPFEPWRQYVNLLIARLPDDGSTEVHPPYYRRPQELVDDLRQLRLSLAEVGAVRLADREVAPVERTVASFGFHLATLDIRQNSAVHEKALAQLLTTAGIDAAEWPTWSEKDKLALLDAELRSPRPLAHPESVLGTEAKLVLDCFRTVAQHRTGCGIDGLGALIVSMTRSLSDLLTVYVLAREAGLVHRVDGPADVGPGLACDLPVVPLFETIDDLDRSPGILDAFLAHPVTKRSLALHNSTRPVQQVMLGYSDSCKDGGIFASAWNLQRAQGRLADAGRKHGVELRFFHGRGGTVSRGAGPTHRFLEALPHGSLGGDLRLTEQGETIAQKYANPVTATHNLELLVAGTTATTVRHQGPAPDHGDTHAILDRLAEASKSAYENLLTHDGFITYFSEATPIDVLEQASIGSRPSRRTGRRTLADLRAIPWVFSWNQSRHYLPGWYGIGSGLATIKKDDPAAFALLRERVRTWPFLRYALTNIESNIASVSPDLMAGYAALVTDSAVRESIFGKIRAEYELAKNLLEEVFGGASIATRRPLLVRTLQLRESGLHALHHQQIALLTKWRQLKNDGDVDGANLLLPDLLLSVNAIASGLRTTG